MASESVFATLTPDNVLAKLAFSGAVDQSSAQESTCRRYMFVGAEQVFDEDVARFLRHSQYHDDPESAASLSLTELDTDAEEDPKRLGMVWKGHYTFNFGAEPTDPSAGWIMGTVKGSKIDFLLGGKPRPGIRHRHAMFNIHKDTGHLYVRSRGSSEGTSRVAVNGESALRGSSLALNQKSMKVNIGPLDYVFDYTDFCYTDIFNTQQQDFAMKFLDLKAPSYDLTPTPASHAWVLAGWTMSKSIGRGSSGKVYSATNSKNRVAAIKLIERRFENARRVKQQIKTLEKITELARTEDDEGRLLRLHDLFYREGKEEYPVTPWEDIALILQPLVTGDFTEITKTAALPNDGGSLRSLEQRMRLFKDALKAVQFLHSHGWLHGDLKPGNIGIYGDGAILLDMESAIQIRPGEKRSPTPGRGGTIPYLAPEREMQDYDLLVDVWSMGVVGFEVLYGRHPWNLLNNPWRPGVVYENARFTFHTKYNEALDILRQSIDGPNSQVRDLLVQMLRHPWALENKQQRVNIHQVLKHSCWLIWDDERASKRAREREA